VYNNRKLDHTIIVGQQKRFVELFP